MKVLIAFGLGLVLLNGTRGADQPKPLKGEPTVKKMVAGLTEIATILEGIKSDADADAAVAKLKTAVKELKALETTLKKEKLSDAESNAVREKLKPQIQEAVRKLADAAIQANKNAPKKAAAIQAALRKKG